MALLILIDGKPFPPERALREQLPLDTLLVCPECGSHDVEAREPKTTIRLGGEAQNFIPRQQDRYCLACNHRWVTVLPPVVYNDPRFQNS
jgi:hypothetical protein